MNEAVSMHAHERWRPASKYCSGGSKNW